MPKYIVICGQEISYQRVLKIVDSIDDVDGYDTLVFPEQHGGPNYLRNIVKLAIQNNTKSIFITRFEFIISEFALAVAESSIDRLDVVFHLYHDGEWTTHYMSEDCQSLGNNWPFGALY